MTKVPRFLFGLALFALSLPATQADELPEFRPALMGTKGTFHRALVNLIDTQGLVKKGQRDAVVFFTCGVKSSGAGGQILIYRGSPGSELLQNELLRLSYRSSFNPAVYQHRQVPVNFIGTVVYVVRDGVPHLRIYLHQQEEDFKSDADFVAPQLAIATVKQRYHFPLWPKTASTKITGAVALVNVEVDLQGKVTGASVAFEHPEGKGFGEEGVKFIRGCAFIPGYRNGRPVACKFTFPVFWGHGHKTTIE